jgi:hypothetical protein
MAVDPAELAAARQRVDLYRACAHPLVPTAAWLLAEVDRLAGEAATGVRGELEPAKEQVVKAEPDLLELLDRRCAVRPGVVPTYDLDLHRRCVDEIMRLREQLAERTLQHKVQMANAARFMLENEVLQRLETEVSKAVQCYEDAMIAAVRDNPTLFQATSGGSDC